MPEKPSLDDRQHAVEFQKMLEAWYSLRVEARTKLHTLARFEPPDDQKYRARAILEELQEHGRPTARFVASQLGSSGSGAILWWVEGQLADQFARDNETAIRYDDIRHIVDNALLQVEAATVSERHFMELAVAEARKSKAEDGGLHPKVGAVVVKDGKVIAAAHRGELAPGDHAEFTALEKKLKDEVVAGATVYATLEPCTRRSPDKTPCAQRLIDRRVKKVVIGVLDPNPVICGKGQRLLQKNGIDIKHFDHDLAMQLEELNRDWTKVQEAAGVPPSAPPPAAPLPDGAAELRELQPVNLIDQQLRAGWTNVLPDELKHLISLELTTPPPIARSIARSPDGQFWLVYWDSPRCLYRWEKITEDYAAEALQPVARYRNVSDWRDLLEE